MEYLLPYLCMVTVPHVMVGLERMLDYRRCGIREVSLYLGILLFLLDLFRIDALPLMTRVRWPIVLEISSCVPTNTYAQYRLQVKSQL